MPFLTPPAAELSLAGKRAVIIEDEGFNILIYRKMLNYYGLRIVGEACNGFDAVAVVLRERPDIVLMDIEMPLMNGLEASARILAAYPVCIVLVTAYPYSVVGERAKEIGISGYVQKPVDKDSLLWELQTAYHAFQAE